MKITLDIQSSARGGHTRPNKKILDSGTELVGYVADCIYTGVLLIYRNLAYPEYYPYPYALGYIQPSHVCQALQSGKCLRAI